MEIPQGRAASLCSTNFSSQQLPEQALSKQNIWMPSTGGNSTPGKCSTKALSQHRLKCWIAKVWRSPREGAVQGHGVPWLLAKPQRAWSGEGVTLWGDSAKCCGGRSEPVPGLRAKVHRQVVLQLHVDLGKVKVHPHVGQGGHVGGRDGADVEGDVVVHGAHRGKGERGGHEGVRGHPGRGEVLRNRPGDDLDPLDLLHGLLHGRANALEAVLCTGRRAKSSHPTNGAPPSSVHGVTFAIGIPYPQHIPQCHCWPLPCSRSSPAWLLSPTPIFPSVGCGAAPVPP